MDMLLTGLSGLLAHEQSLDVISHNIANATTPGYSRQNADLVPAAAVNVPAGLLGKGVTVSAIKRIASDFLVEQLRQSQTESGRLDQMNTGLTTAQSSFNEPGTNGLSATISQLFSSFANVANNPESSALSSTVVQQLGAFTDSLNNLGTQLMQQRTDAADSLQGQVQQADQLFTSISSLNQQIRDQSLRGASPNDLLDQRDQLVSQLSKMMKLTVRTDATDGTVRIDSSGQQLVGTNYAERLSVGETSDGSIALLLHDRTAAAVQGGSIGALIDLHDQVLPALQSDLDTLASTLAHSLNACQATGISAANGSTSFVSDYAIDGGKSSTNLDDASQTQAGTSGTGIPKAFLPSFTAANGNLTTRNLAINVYDPATQTAQKYIVRYDPATAGGTRSLDDLIAVINSGRSTPTGGFTLYPPGQGGITGVTAAKVTVDGGDKLVLTASGGRTIDFSTALDLAPAATAWSSPTTTLSGTDPALANQRLVLRVHGTNLEAYTTSPTTGVESLYAQTPIAGLSAVPTAFGTGGLQLAAPSTIFHDGDAFAVDFNATGAIATSTGTAVQATAWTSGDAAMRVSGRYTGALGFTPGQDWSMRVVTPGTIGDATHPPLVAFTYYTGPADAPVRQTTQVTLDATKPAGSPITIADGVSATFSAGTLSTTGNQLSWNVDAQPDQAGLLPALGIGTLLSGSSATTLAVSSAIQADPTLLALGQTRAAGDNANVLKMTAVQQAKLFDAGASTADEFYQTTVAGLGVQVAQNQTLQNTQTTLATSIENQRQAISGVSIDQEVGNMILQQQAYTASARLITTARDDVQTLLNLLQ